MVLFIVGLSIVFVASWPNPTYYFGETLFGIKLMPYWVMNWIMVFVGGLDMGYGFRMMFLR